MTKDIKNRIPIISPERINNEPLNTLIGSTKEEKTAYAFLKGKEQTQPFTIRIPIKVYQELRQIAFDKNEKINQIIISLIRGYNESNNS